MSTTSETPTTTEYRDGDRCGHDYWPTACGACLAPAVAYNLQDELQRAEAGRPSTIPCPPWCEQAGNHPYDVPSMDSTTRMHKREVPARDGAPTVVIWGYDLLEGTHREFDEPEIGAKDSNKADVPLRHVSAFTEAMLEAAKLVEEQDQAPGFRLYADDEADDVLAQMAREPIDVEAALRGVDGVMESLASVVLPLTPQMGSLLETDEGNITLTPEPAGATLAITATRSPEHPAYVHLDADTLLDLAATVIRLRVYGASTVGRQR